MLGFLLYGFDIVKLGSATQKKKLLLAFGIVSEKQLQP
jgi:hypothetical protein